MPKYACCFLLFVSVSVQAAIVSQESFETDGEGTRYTSSNTCNDGSADFFTRTDGSNIGSFYQVSGPDGSFYWAAQDTNAEAPCGQTENLTLNAVDVAGFTNLTVDVLIAEDQSSDGNEDWDDNSAFIVEYAYDGATFTPGICFAGTGTFNTEPLLDTDCDGTGDGAALTPTFQTFSASIPDDASDSLTVRLRTVNLDDGDEDVAFDNIIINGDVVVDNPPQLTTTAPEDLAPGVQVTSTLTLAFDETVSATAAAVTLDCGGGALTFSGLPATADTIVLTPDADLPAGSSCDVTLVADEITDQDGTTDTLDGDANGTADGSPADDFVFSFSTLTDPPPQVAATDPLANATGVATDTTITLDFNENVSLTENAVTLDCGTAIALTGLPATDVADIQLTPASSLPALTQCTVNVLSSGVSDVDGGDDPLDGNADGTGGDDFSFSFTTTEGVCGDGATLISAIQGNMGTPNLLNETVVVEGIVVGDYQDDTGNAATDTSLLDGFFVQEEDGDADGDAATSEGIFIFEGGPTATDVSLGDRVRVIGTVSDSFAQTQLSAPTITICDSGNSVSPAQVLLPRQSAVEYEAVEGMLVQFSQELTVSEIFNAVRFGELTVSDGRLIAPTQATMPGVDANNQLALNELNQLLLDDGRDGSNNEPLAYGFTADNPQRAGDTFTDVRGVMGFAFGAFRLRPVDSEFFVTDGTNARTAQPDNVGGSLKAAAFNVLNYFTTIDTGGAACGPGLVGCRGADSTFEFTRQEAKIVSALLALDAQLVGLVELENNASQSLADLVDALNTAAGEPGRYAFVDTGLIGADVIKVGLIYQPAAVTPTGSFAVLDATVDPLFDSFLNRPALAQTFTANGESFTVVVNHLKSKSCSNATGDNLGQGDGQGCFNAARTDAASALATWLATDPTGSGDPDVLILGDLNAYAMEDPITALRDGGFIDLIARDLGSNAYSFRFNRQAGYLDYALATETLALQVTGVTAWPINADESRLLDYNEESVSGLVKPASFFSDSAFRSSDHDPIVVGLELAPLPDEIFSNSFEENAPIMR
ncbi:MAG: ExeM/NucH family extracellular endonuclease [Pseudomonadota bacterium]